MAILIVILFLAMLYIGAVCGRVGHPGMKDLRGWAYAHRGLHGEGRPENSMAAFRAALENGYGIELDVQLSSDKVPMVIHDADLDRICGVQGKVWDYTCAELQQMKHIQPF